MQMCRRRPELAKCFYIQGRLEDIEGVVGTTARMFPRHVPVHFSLMDSIKVLNLL